MTPSAMRFFLVVPKILTDTCDSGRGVHANERIKAGTIIEISPVLVLPPSDVPAVEPTTINHYS